MSQKPLHTTRQSCSLSFDPVHGYIPFVHREEGGGACEKDLIDSPWLQRLREIHQLQTAWYVFPTAEHTRFQHVLGAMHLASQFAKRLYPSLKEVCPETPSLGYVESLVRMAALLHDVGHGPFGHFFDQHFLSQYGLTHETLGAEIIRQKLSPMLRDIRRNPSSELAASETLDPEQVAWLIVRPVEGDQQQQPQWLIYLRSLFCGIYTVDNCDFVMRDAYMSGYSHHAYDLDRLLHYSFFSERGLTISDRGVDALVRFLAVRAELFRSIYFHRTIRALDLTLTDLFRDSAANIFPGNPLDRLDEYQQFTEWTLLVDARRWVSSQADDLRELGQRWADFLQRKVDWKMLCQRNIVFRETDKESGSIFSDAGLLEAKIRSSLPEELNEIPLRVDTARHIYRPDSRKPARLQNFLFDTAADRVRPLFDHELFRHFPISQRVCRVYGRSRDHAPIVSEVMDGLLGSHAVDDVTNM